MFYLECEIGNFIYCEKPIQGPFHIVFGKFLDDSIIAFSEEEFSVFNFFVKMRKDNFTILKTIPGSSACVDLYDSIRDYKMLPDCLIFNGEHVKLLDANNMIELPPTWGFTPVGTLIF